MCEVTKPCTTQPAWWVQVDTPTGTDTPDASNVLACNRHLAQACRRIHKKRTHQQQRVTVKFAVLDTHGRVVGYQ